MTREERLAKKRASMKSLYQRNGEAMRAKNRARYAANREKYKAAVMRYNREVLGRRPRAPKQTREVALAKKRDQARAKMYGVTPADLASMIEAQANRCKICQTTFTRTRDRHVDHDHATGRVRGLLCRLCNLGIGALRENPDTLKRAIRYLKEE